VLVTKPLAAVQPEQASRESNCQASATRFRATFPDASHGLGRFQHGYGTTRRVTHDFTSGTFALQRKLRHFKVPARSSKVTDLRSTQRSVIPAALRHFDPVGVVINPPPECGQRLLERSTELGEFVELCSVNSGRIERPPDKTVTLCASQGIGEDFVGDALKCGVEVL